MLEENQPIHNFGGIFTPNTTATDQLSQRLMMGYGQNRKLQQQQQNLLDKEFSKELTNIKSADVPEFSKAYQDYATLYKAYNKHPGGPSLQQQQELMQAKANAFQTADASIDQKAKEKDMYATWKAHPERYADDFDGRMKGILNTPTSKLHNLDWQTPLLYDGANYKDAQKDMTDAMGKPLTGVVGQKQPVIGADGKPSALQFETPTYNFPSGNTGDQVRTAYLTKMAATKDAQKFYTLQAGKLDPVEVAKTDALYQQLPDDKWKLMGKTKPVLNNQNPTDPLNEYATYMGQLHELHNVPAAGKPIPFVDQSAKMDRQLSERNSAQQERERFAMSMQKDRQAFISKYGNLSTQDLTKNIEGVLQHLTDTGEPVSTGLNKLFPSFGLPDGAVKLNLGSSVNAFGVKDAKGKTQVPAGVYRLPNGNFKLEGNGFNSEIDYGIGKAEIVKYLAPNKAEQNQLNTNSTIQTGSKNKTTQSTTIKTVKVHGL